jgi:predicted nucleotidyltransferase
MTNISLNLSGKIPDDLVKNIRLVVETIEGLQIPYFLIGAMAQRLILQIGYNIRTRETEDIDFGIAVNSWEDYDKLKLALIATNQFMIDRQPQRLLGKDRKTWIDIVPFGRIELPKGQISWQSTETVMTTYGFTEAFNSALNVKIADDLTIKVVSLSGFVLLKFMAWSDRKNHKDLQDIFLLMREYLDAGNRERLYDEHRDLLTADFDNDFASSEILGRDLSLILTDETSQIIAKIFNNLEPLIIPLLREKPFDDVFEKRLEIMFERLKKGIFR